ncbi:MAG: uroporphyrinogen decarboxylase family protein [Candidatus Aenigmatarchaeota archaeon]
MNSRERVICAIEHEEPDRIPLEGVAWGEWSYPFLKNVLIPYFKTENIDNILENLGIDFRSISMEPSNNFKKKAIYDPRFDYPWGIEIAPETLKDEWGVIRKLNITKNQSRIIYHPLKDKEDLKDYNFPNIEEDGRFDEAEKLVKKWKDKYAISAIWGGDSFFCQSWYLRGFNEFIKDLYYNEKFANELLDNLLKIFLYAIKRLIEIGADIICIADDIAMQKGMIISPFLFRKYIKPRMKKIIDICKKEKVYVVFHTDGNCEEIIPDLIEIGVDILNPIQPECMDPAKIKEKYGDKITLSGTISLQKTLPYGTIEDVKNEVIKRIETCAYNGGFILSPSNQVLLDVKIENFIALYEFAKKYGKYPIYLRER